MNGLVVSYVNRTGVNVIQLQNTAHLIPHKFIIIIIITINRSAIQWIRLVIVILSRRPVASLLITGEGSFTRAF